MKTVATLIIPAILVLSTTVAFADGDVEAGEKMFKRCKACHSIVNDTEVIVKGGRSGPNLYGVIGRTAGTAAEFDKYSKSIMAAGEAGLVWTPELIPQFIADPAAFLRDYLDDPKARSNMTQKFKDGEDVVAYLASVGPEIDDPEMEEEDEQSEE